MPKLPKRILTLSLLLVGMLLGCVSTYMKDFVGKDITEVMMVSGEPLSIFDLPDGSKAYQYRIGGGAVAIPGRTQTTGTSAVIGNTVSTSESGVSYPPAVLQATGCLVSYITKLDPVSNRRIVVDIRYPKQLVC